MAPLNSTQKQGKIPLGEGLSSQHHTTKRMLCFEKKTFHDEESFKNLLTTSLNDPDDNTFKNNVLCEYNKLYQTYTRLTEEESIINRMERKAHIRNTFFRGVTTLVIGFSIMLVYWAATCLEISMPLMRIPL
jgi:hypothetical protein